MSSQDYYQPPPGPPPTHQQPQAQGAQYNAYQQNQTPAQNRPPHYQQQGTPNLPPRGRNDPTEAALPQGQERAEQLEYMQSFEASAPRTEDDDNQAILEREYPAVDASLIAALYGDSKSLSATRELLQELTREG